MCRDHRMLMRPVAVVGFALALASPAIAADYIPDEGCGLGCNGRAQGYAFAESNNISDPYVCEGRGQEFFAGCVAFVELQHPRRVWIAPQPQPFNGGYGAQPYGAQPFGGQRYAAPGYGAGAAPDVNAEPEYNQGYEPPEQGDGGPGVN